MKKLLLLVILLGSVYVQAQTALSIQGGGIDNVAAATLVDNLVGQGVTFLNAHFTGTTGHAAGTVMNNGYFGNGNATVGISTGIILSTGNIFRAEETNTVDSATYFWLNCEGDANIESIMGQTTYDACGLEFDFIPQSDVISFRYVFASEEYPEFVGDVFNDAFAFFVSGPNPSGGLYTNLNIALIPGTSTPVAINNVNSGTNFSYYRNNSTGAYHIQYDGFTTVLTATVNVVPCQQYHMKLVISDVYDPFYDSAVFLEAGSFTSPSIDSIGVAYSQPAAGGNSAAVEGCSNAIISIGMSAPSGQPRKVPFYLSGAATFNTDFTTIPDITSTYNNPFPNQFYITIPAGQTSTNLTIVPVADTDIEVAENVLISVQMNFCDGASYQDGSILIIDNSVPLSLSVSSDTTICQGQNTSITASPANGQQPLSYLWVPGNMNTSNINVSPLDTTVYHVTITDACGIEIEDSSKVNVFPVPTATISGDTSLCNTGVDTAFLSVHLTGMSPWIISYSDGTNTFTEDSIYSSPFIISLSPASTTTYALSSVSDINCSYPVIGQSATVTMIPLPTATLTGSADLCNTGTQNTQLSVNFTGTPDWSFVYSDGVNTEIINGITTSPYTFTVYPGSTTTYTLLEVSDADCYGIVSGNAIVSVHDLPLVSLGSDTNLCDGANITLDAGNPGLSYLWSTNETTQTINVTTSGTYSVVVTSPYACTGSDTINLSINPMPPSVITGDTLVCRSEQNVSYSVPADTGHVYNWSVVGGNIVTGQGTNEIFVNWGAGPTGSVALFESVPATGCYSSATINISVGDYPVADVVQANPITCYEGADGALFASATGGNPPYSYFWSNSGINDTIYWLAANAIYSVTVTDSYGCAATDSMSLSQPDQLGLALSIINVSCFGYNDGTVTATLLGGTPPYSYTWSTGIANETISDLSGGEYIVTASDVNNCFVSDTAVINASSTALVASVTHNDASCFNGNNGSISVSMIGGTAPYSYNWSTLETTSSIASLTAGAYTVTVSDAYFCADTISVVVFQGIEIIGTHTAFPTSCNGNNDGKIDLTISGGHVPYSYLWSNGAVAEDITELRSGNYTVTVKDSLLCSVSFDIVVLSGAGECLEIPSAFSPNSDGKNDKWIIKYLELYPPVTVEIYSRWGTLIYKSDNYAQNPWDGTFKGTETATGSYVYIINLNDGSEPFSGTITIIR